MFYISLKNWKEQYQLSENLIDTLQKDLLKEITRNLNLIAELRQLQHENDRLHAESYVYRDSDGKLRFKHNGQFAPDNRTKTKKLHDQLRAEVAYKKTQAYTEEQPSDNCAVGHYTAIKKASKV